MRKTEVNESELENVHSEENSDNSKKIFLKVALFASGIVAGIIILAVLFSIYLLPVYRYNQAENYAGKGDYVTASNIMYHTKHKDSNIKYGKYACLAAEKYYSDNDIDNAKTYFIYAYNSQDEESKLEAVVYLYKIDSSLINYSDSLVDLVITEADKLYDSGIKGKAKVYYNYALSSQNESIRNKAEARINE